MANIYGTTWDDYLDGTNYADNIYAEAGDDSVYAGDGDDYVDGWTGDDYVDGGAGDDYVDGYDGNDTLDGWTGDDYINGEAGDDYILGYDGNDTLVGGAGNDDINGEYGDDILTGYGFTSYEYDELTGGDGADTFVLGDSWGAFYEGSGYATITDFNGAEGDKIQVYGSIDDYTLSEYGGGMDIYYQGDVVGYVENTTNVIASLDFEFV